MALSNELRPTDWASFINQDKAKEILQRAIGAAESRQEVLDHVLLYGPSGLGKSSLARLIGGGELKVLLGKALTRTTLWLTFSLVKGRRWTGPKFVFIDEIHAVEPDLQEELLGSLEQTSSQFTLIGATTKPAKLLTPLKNRFPIALRLHFYSVASLARIAQNSAEALGVVLEGSADLELARRSRGIPRTVNDLLRRVRDVKSRVSEVDIVEILDWLGVDSYGLRGDERVYLFTLFLKFNGGPASLSTLSGSLAEDKGTVSELYEPFLLRSGLIEITSRGRQLTGRGFEYLKTILEEKEAGDLYQQTLEALQ